MSVHRMKKVLEDLKTMPMTTRELLEVNPVTQPTISVTIKALRKRGLVRISGWRRSERQGPYSPVYALGSEQDASRPKPKSSKERNKKYWDANRARISAKRSGAKSTVASWMFPIIRSEHGKRLGS